MNDRRIILTSHIDHAQSLVEILEPLRSRKSSVSLESEAGPDGVPLPKIKYQGREFLTAQVRYSKRTKRVTLQRTLVSKIVFRPESVTRTDILIVYDNLLYIQDIALSNENFRLKFGKSLEVLTKILRGFRLSSKTNLSNIRKLSESMKEHLEGFYIPLRNLSTELKKCQEMYRIVPFVKLGKDKRTLPPKAYIGKGYTDHGTAKEPAIDGSPSWQEVAQQDLDGEFEDGPHEVCESNPTQSAG